MIRINLMGAAGKRPKAAKVMPDLFAASTPPTTWIGAALIIAALLALGGNYLYVQHQAAVLADQMTAARQEAIRLQAVRREYEENTQRRQQLTQRIGVIDDLKRSQSGPSALLAVIRNSVDATPAVWLTSVSQKEGTLDIEGSALNLAAVANLMTALKRSGYFRQIDLHQSVQATGRGGENPFTFTLTAAPESTSASAAAPLPAGKRS